jgi:thiol-disulfide isomerase/thioredoxin
MKKLIAFLLIASSAQLAFSQQYVIKANITGFKNGAKFYLNDVETDTNIDSAAIAGNAFMMKGKLPQSPSNLWVTSTVDGKSYFFILLIGSGTISVQGDIKDMPYNLITKGSKIDDINEIALKQEGPLFKRRNKLIEDYFALPANDSTAIKGKAIWKNIAVIDSEDVVVRTNFVKKYINSYAALNCLFFLKDNLSKQAITSLYESLTPQYKQSRYGQRIATFLKVGKILEQGDMAADFEAIGNDNKPHRLNDSKGKYILLDFSSTNCGPCVESVGELKALAKKHANDLSIITFSGDGGKATWLEGVNRDKPTWLSLWDGKGYYGETIIKYGVHGFPTFVLIDHSGKIVSKWSGYGPGSIESKINSLISKAL